MTADALLEQIADRGWLSNAVLERVRAKVAGRSIDAESIARFLVDKGHLTDEQVGEILGQAGDEPEPLVEPMGGAPEETAPAAAPAEPLADDAGGDAAEADRLEEGGATGGRGRGSAEAKAARAERRKKERERRKKYTSEWESPLMLIGTAGLILLLLCGFGVYYLLLRGSGDDLLNVADTSFTDGNYSQAIGQYEQFLKDYPTHEGSGLARVHLGLSRIRQALEVSKNFELALDRTATEIPAMVKTEDFEEAQRDLSALLPRIATGLVGEADAADDLAGINKYVGLTNKALDLNQNNKYVPSQIRNKQETRQVEEVLRRIARRQEALQALEDTLGVMRSATSGGDIRPAYEAHAALLKNHPELASRGELTEAIAAAVTAERGAVRFVDEPAAGETSEADSAVAAVVATADRRREGNAPASGAAVFQFEGVAYGLDAASGRLLWRRSLGDGLVGAAPLIADQACLVIDARREELVAVDPTTGRLLWRSPIGEPALPPVRLGERVLIATRGGRLHAIDLATGRRTGHVRFAQPLAAPPTASADGRRIYLVGEHSSVYTLSADDLSCLGVFYLGHVKGSVVAPPATLLGKVLVAENDGLATSKLHVLAVDDEGVVDDEIEVVGLKGLSPVPPIVFGRRLAAVTDAGQITVYETSPQDRSSGLTEVAARRSRKRRPTTHHAALVGERLWVAGHGLAKYAIQPTGNRLPKEEVRDPFESDVLVGPLVVRDGVLLHARRRRARPGLTITATDAGTGAAYWETDVAVPAAGPPSASASRREVLQTSATGRVITTPANTPTAIAAPASAPDESPNSLLTAAAPDDVGALLVAGPGGSGLVRIGADGLVDRPRLPGRVACEPTVFGDGWLVPLSLGQVFYLDRDAAARPAVPFQPERKTGEPTSWLPAGGGLVRGEPTAVATNGRGLYSLRLFGGSPPRLEVIAETTLERELGTRVAVAAGQAVAGRVDGSVAVFDVESLDLVAESPPADPIAWGPYAVGDRVLIAGADGRLTCYEPAAAETATLKPSWSTELADADLVGGPLAEGDRVVVATRAGGLHRLSLLDGEIGSTSVGESLASSASLVGDRIVLAAADGALVFVKL